MHVGIAKPRRRGKRSRHSRRMRNPQYYVSGKRPMGVNGFPPSTVPSRTRHDQFMHPSEKVIGLFIRNQIRSRLLKINRLCLVCIKRSIEELKKCQISKRSYQQGLSDKTLKKARCQFCHVKFGHRIMEAMGFFEYEILPKLLFISQTGEASVLFHDFLILFCLSDIFVN